MRKLLVLAAGIALLLLNSLPACAAIPIPTGAPYSQSFDGLGAVAVATLPLDFRVDATPTSTPSDVRKLGSFAAARTTTARLGGANLSSSAANGIYNFGAGTSAAGSDRAVGFLASGTATASGNLYVHLANQTGAGLSGLQLSYCVEKYRNGSNPAGFRVQLYYSRDGAAWTSAGDDFFTSFSKDANDLGFATAPGATAAVTGKTLAVSIPNGGDFYLAWNYSATSGTTVTNAQALAIDGISILGVNTPAALPSPTPPGGPSTSPFFCGSPATPIHAIQGSGLTSAMSGQTVDVEGIVVGSFQGASKLRGFYLEQPDATWDSDPATSEGIFIFESATGPAVRIGDRVRVRGAVSELTTSGSFLGKTQSSSLTEIEMSADLVCSSGNSFTVTPITLPISDLTDWERYEGMAVQLTQLLTVTGNYSLGAEGWIDLAPSVLYAPTSVSDQTTWPSAASLNSRSVLALDDGSTLTDASLYPTLFPQGGLSASHTLRVGDLVNYDSTSRTNTPLVGVLDNRYGEYRLQPTAPVTFYNANVRPAIAPLLSSFGGRFRAVSANVLNFFTTLGSRGARTQAEFDHQKTKIIEALYAMNGDVYGLSEVQNFDDGQTGRGGNSYTNVALQSLVDGLNCKASALDALCAAPTVTPYVFIDTIPLGAANGTDAIRNAIIYRTAAFVPVGNPAAYYQGDTNRPTLAQTFQPASGANPEQQTFTFVVNHFRSKSSACGGGSDDLYQGDCNGLRLNMAQNVVTWLAGNPTHDPAGANRRVLLAGDFNAYFGEDPIQYFGVHGYINLVNAVIGPAAYSYNFGSQAGYLDHALANSAMNALVKSVAEWHNNADEPSSLEALDSSDKSPAAQVAYYDPDPWAASDHDPLVIGFNTLLGDLNDDGVVDAQDQVLLNAAIGKSASQVDRRMDYDGDGVITLRDYQIWAAYDQAFQQ